MKLVKTMSIVSILFCGAIFGFFYAWVCSTMWGLDQADPRIAIAAMQAMNASVRNAVFFPAFFLTPVVLAVTAGVAYRGQFRSAALWFAAAGLIYLIFGLFLTMGINVPMNEELATVDIPNDVEAATAIWQNYSPRWQFWNQTRTIASGVALAFCGLGLSRLSSEYRS